MNSDMFMSPKVLRKGLKRGLNNLKNNNNNQIEERSEGENTTLESSKYIKRRIPISPRAVKKICNRSTSDKDEPSLDSDLDRDTIKTILNKNKAASHKAKDNNSEKGQESQDEEEHELDITIDTLPVLIRTEDQGKLFEIEIIDTVEKDSEPMIRRNIPHRTYSRQERTQTTLNKINEMPEVSIKKIDAQTVVDNLKKPVARNSAGNELAKLFDLNNDRSKALSVEDKKMPGLKKPDKRCLKRVHIQSKLKRLGMLPIANFEPSEDVELQEEVGKEIDVANDGRDQFSEKIQVV